MARVESPELTGEEQKQHSDLQHSCLGPHTYQYTQKEMKVVKNKHIVFWLSGQSQHIQATLRRPHWIDHCLCRDHTEGTVTGPQRFPL